MGQKQPKFPQQFRLVGFAPQFENHLYHAEGNDIRYFL